MTWISCFFFETFSLKPLWFGRKIDGPNFIPNLLFMGMVLIYMPCYEIIGLNYCCIDSSQLHIDASPSKILNRVKISNNSIYSTWWDGLHFHFHFYSIYIVLVNEQTKYWIILHVDLFQQMSNPWQWNSYGWYIPMLLRRRCSLTYSKRERVVFNEFRMYRNAYMRYDSVRCYVIFNWNTSKCWTITWWDRLMISKTITTVATTTTKTHRIITC